MKATLLSLLISHATAEHHRADCERYADAVERRIMMYMSKHDVPEYNKWLAQCINGFEVGFCIEANGDIEKIPESEHIRGEMYCRQLLESLLKDKKHKITD